MTTTVSTRLFKSDFWERFTHVHHNTPLFIYIPVILASVAYSLFAAKFSLMGTAVAYLLGLLDWTFVEYIMHRVFFHYEPKSHWGKRLHYLFHGIHHDYPNEADRLVMPVITSIPLALILLGIHFALFGKIGIVVFAGFVTGYLYYEFVHYSVHHKKKVGWLWSEGQRKHHFKHHFQDATNRFGVTSPLWDYIFGTYH